MLSVLLIACMAWFSVFQGPAQSAVKQAVKKDCCAKMGKNACKHTPSKSADDDCAKPGCMMFLTCSYCGFIITEPLALKSTYATQIPKPSILYTAGDLSAYHPSNWKPPRAC